MFSDDRLRGLGVAGGQILAFPIDFDCRPYNILSHYRASVWWLCQKTPKDDIPMLSLAAICWTLRMIAADSHSPHHVKT